MKPRNKRKLIKKLLMTNGIPMDVTNIIIEYGHSAFNELLYGNKNQKMCIPILRVEFDWDLFTEQVQCEHNKNDKKNKQMIILKTDNGSRNYIYDNTPELDYCDKKYCSPKKKKEINHSSILYLKNFYRYFNGKHYPVEKKENDYLPLHHFKTEHNIYNDCMSNKKLCFSRHVAHIYCQTCGGNKRFGYDPDKIIYDGIVTLKLEYSNLDIIIL